MTVSYLSSLLMILLLFLVLRLQESILETVNIIDDDSKFFLGLQASCRVRD